MLLVDLQVLNFNNNYSGLILLVGQLADGISTTVVGGLSDRPDPFILCRCGKNWIQFRIYFVNFNRKYGQKKSWHMVGLISVLISFPFIFMPCISCEDSDGWAQLIYYSAFAVVFQFGWASMQVNLIHI